MAFGDEDLGALMVDAGEEVWFGSKHATVLFREGDTVTQDGMGNDIVVRGTSFLVATKELTGAGSLSGLARENAVTRAGVSYRVRDLRTEGDGTLTRVLLAKG